MPEKQTCQYRLRRPADETQKIRAVRDFVSANRDDPGIIFCAASSRAESVSAFLEKQGFAVVCILPDEDAAVKLAAFSEGKANILVAVTGTGLQISKTDVRYVLHYNLPLSLNDYLQEASCAGRDGKGGQCILFYLPKDRRILENRLKRSLLNCRTDEERNILKSKKVEYAEMLHLCDMPAAEAEKNLQQRAAKRIDSSARKRIGQKSAAGKTNRQKKAGKDRPDEPVSHEDSGVLCVSMAPEAERIRKGDDPEISYFDLMTADAAFTLMQCRAKKIYARNIMELLSGNRTLTLRPEKKKEIERILRKLAESGLLLLQETENGFAYDPSERSSFYAKAERRQKIGRIPAGTLHVPGVPTSEENLALTHYLYMHIINGKKDIPTEEMWKALGIVFPEGAYYKKRKEQTILRKAETILKHFASKDYIREFAITQKQIHMSR